MKKILFLLALCLFPRSLWADSKLSALSEYLTPKATDYVYVISNNGISFKAQFGNFPVVASGGGGGGSFVVTLDSGSLIQVTTMVFVTNDFKIDFLGSGISTAVVHLSSNVARLSGSSETFIYENSLNFNAPQLYFNGRTGYGGGQDFVEFNNSNSNPRYFIIRQNNNAGEANLMLVADPSSVGFTILGRAGASYNDSTNGPYIQNATYLGLGNSGRLAILDRSPLGGAQASYLVYLTSGMFGINTSTPTAYFTLRSTANFTNEPFLVLISSANGARIFGMSKSSGVFEIDLIAASLTTVGDITPRGKVVKRVVGVADAASITPNINTTDISTQTNTQVLGTLTMNAPTGTPADGQSLVFRIRSTNIQTFSWNAVYRGGTSALPTVTTGSDKIDYFCFLYNATDNHWDYTGGAGGFAP